MLAKLFEFILHVPFYDSRLNSLDLKLTLTGLAWSTIFLAAMFISKIEFIFLWMLVSAVLSFKLGSSISCSVQQAATSMFVCALDKINWKTDVQPSAVDFFVRFSWKYLLQKISYADDIHSITQEMIIDAHINACRKGEKCFCSTVLKVS